MVLKRLFSETPFDQRYQKVMSIIGVDPSHLSGDVGHA
jgi:putative transcriptional regulator